MQGDWVQTGRQGQGMWLSCLQRPLQCLFSHLDTGQLFDGAGGAGAAVVEPWSPFLHQLLLLLLTSQLKLWKCMDGLKLSWQVEHQLAAVVRLCSGRLLGSQSLSSASFAAICDPPPHTSHPNQWTTGEKRSAVEVQALAGCWEELVAGPKHIPCLRHPRHSTHSPEALGWAGAGIA